MINLPKPSAISMKNSSNGKADYLFSYLKTLVGAIESAFPSKIGDEEKAQRYVTDIRLNDGTLKVTYSNGEEKQISI